jgi:hypothetical protein
MRRFFRALRVRDQVVAGPLPDVVQPVQGPAKGVFGHPLLRGDLQDLAEQGHRPTDVRVAEVLGRDGEEGLQQMLLVLIQQGMTPPASLVLEGRRVVALEVSPDPVIDTLSGDSEHAGDVGGRATVVELQDGEGPPEEAGIPGLRELTSEAPPLPGGQVESAHGLLLDRWSCS